ncbi:MAG: phosphoribosylglycinamide formyltransferase [Actinomycetota bacterium]
MSGRIATLISGAGSNMLALTDACERGEVPGTPVVVAADRKCEGLSRAQERGLETVLVEFGAYRERARWDDALLETIDSYEPDLVVSAGFMRLLAPSFIDAFGDRLINLHPSLLPAFPGAHAIRDALAHGVKVVGTTVHFVDYDVDHGPIILQEAVHVEPDDTEEMLHERIKVIERRALPRACKLFLEGRLSLDDGRVRVRE